MSGSKQQTRGSLRLAHTYRQNRASPMTSEQRNIPGAHNGSHGGMPPIRCAKINAGAHQDLLAVC